MNNDPNHFHFMSYLIKANLVPEIKRYLVDHTLDSKIDSLNRHFINPFSQGTITTENPYESGRETYRQTQSFNSFGR